MRGLKKEQWTGLLWVIPSVCSYGRPHRQSSFRRVLSALFNIHSFTRILTALSGDRCVMAGVPLTLQLPLSLLSSSSSSSLSLCLFFFNQFDKVNSLSTRSLGRIHQLLAAVFIQLESFAHTKSQTWQVDYRPVQTVWGCELWPAAYGQKKTQQWPRIHMDKCVAGAPCGFVMTSVECQNYIKVKMYRVQPLQKKSTLWKRGGLLLLKKQCISFCPNVKMHKKSELYQKWNNTFIIDIPI